MNWTGLHETEMRKQTCALQTPRNPKNLAVQASALPLTGLDLGIAVWS